MGACRLTAELVLDGSPSAEPQEHAVGSGPEGPCVVPADRAGQRVETAGRGLVLTTAKARPGQPGVRQYVNHTPRVGVDPRGLVRPASGNGTLGVATVLLVASSKPFQSAP